MLFCLCVACSGSGTDASGEPLDIEVTRAVPVADVTVMDVYRPEEGADLPLLVLLHGTGTGGRAEMEPLARAIAERGVVVFVPSWKVILDRPAWPMADAEVYRVQTEAVVCALRQARRTALDYGGSAERLGLMGHSGGALVGLRVALVDEPPWSGMACDEGVDHRPDVFIGTGGDYSGAYQFAGVAGDLYDPLLLMGGNAALDVLLVHGSRDNNVDAFASGQLHEQLVQAGYDAEYTALDTRHGALIRPDEPAGQFVVDRVVALLGTDDRDDENTEAELAFDGTTCSYSGPNTLEPGERLPIRLSNNSEAPAAFLFYNIEGVELDVALLTDAEPLMPNPSYVDTGSVRMVPAGAERFMSWAFVDRPYQWVLACVDDIEPHGTAYYRAGEDAQVYQAAGLAPTNLAQGP